MWAQTLTDTAQIGSQMMTPRQCMGPALEGWGNYWDTVGGQRFRG